MLKRRELSAAAGLALAAALSVGSATAGSSDPEGLPPDAPRSGTVITIDVSRNMAYLFRDGELVRKSRAATGMDRVLVHGDSVWLFRTPRGRWKVVGKVRNPVWRKPDWAFIEEGRRVPPANAPERLVRGKLGRYALTLGDGIMIHGTDDPKSIGRRVSHGCIRLPDGMMALLYREAKVGTEVYIFDSRTDPNPRWRAELDAALGVTSPSSGPARDRGDRE
ncbi:MAG TPA: L,D-transpeptidase [Thermoanaerobaculia bacterium]|nr:L,D-transpeptidase [Thermoanaerobaculia bacterium]